MVQTEQQTTIDEAAIERMLEFSRAMVSGDADALEELLAPDFTYTHMSARVEPREELMESIRGGRHNDRMDFENLRVRSYPGATIVNGLNHMRLDYADRPSLIVRLALLRRVGRRRRREQARGVPLDAGARGVGARAFCC